jgi:hypothetical protein
MQAAKTIDLGAILNDSAASDWLKDALSGALTRDPVDAANDAEIVAQVLRLRAEAVLEALHQA